ncbi:riboflavin synthase [Gluconobacter sp. LMG 31484]|uniref:Riboflavin synthase n=1 Tax=Gluconobacter vitians TaxID=2728102 RepID=A0ABR9Y4L1_9PROT|nr:riboflavin synthase [Gluconobacter vitians]MBF0858770.1 riboflavin synthase [Gluconobacter vitians]
MFSGIIERLGTVRSASVRAKAMDLTVETGFPDLELGESVAVNGVCLTVETFDSAGVATFHLSGETLSRTPLDQLKPGSRVNLERAVAASTRLSGHIVQGHVDGVATLASVEKAGDSYALRAFVPQALRQYVVEKGSITFDGISLTVNELHDDIIRGNQAGFEVGLTIIPHTWEHTNLSTLSVGDRMDVEVDVLSKYVENLLRFSPSLAKAAS